MVSNIPLERPDRITSAELGMFSLDPGATDSPPSEETIRAINRLSASIAQVYESPTVDTLEQRFGLSPLARPGSLVRRAAVNVGIRKSQQLPFAQRRINVIEHLFALPDLEFQRQAITLLDNCDTDTQEKYHGQVERYIELALNSHVAAIRRSGIDLFDRLSRDSRNQHIRSLLLERDLIQRDNALMVAKVHEAIGKIDTADQINFVFEIFDGTIPAPLWFAGELTWALDKTSQIQVLEGLFSDPTNNDMLYDGLQLLKQCSPGIQVSMVPTVLTTIENTAARLTSSGTTFSAASAFDPTSEAQKILILTMIENGNREFDSILLDKLREQDGAYTHDVLMALVDYPGQHFTEIIEQKWPDLDVAQRHELAVALLGSDDPNRKYLALSFMNDMEPNEIQPHLDTMFEYFDSLKIHILMSSHFFGIIEKFDPQTRLEIALHFFDLNNSDLLARTLRYARELDVTEKTRFAEMREDELAQLVISGHHQSAAVELASFLPPEKFLKHKEAIREYVQTLLRNPDPLVQVRGIELLASLGATISIDSDVDVMSLLRSALATSDPTLAINALYAYIPTDENMKVALFDNVNEALKTLIRNREGYSAESALTLINELPEQHRPFIEHELESYFEAVLQQRDEFAQSQAFRALKFLPPETQVELISDLTEDQRSIHDGKVVDIIKTLPLEHRAPLIREMITNVNGWYSQSKGWDMLNELASELAVPILCDIIQQHSGLSGHDKQTVERALFILDKFSTEEKREARDLILSISPSPRSSILHDEANFLSPKKLEKTGSETIILPSPYESSVRIIDKDTAHTWLNVYCSVDKWKEAGFDYVPVEPIIDISNAGDGAVNVTTINLRGRSLNKSHAFLSLYSPEVSQATLDTARKIVDTMQEMGLEHGHTHKGNFVVVPHTDPSGEIDFDKAPRVYVIDFDRSRFRHGAPRMDASSSPKTLQAEPMGKDALSR